MVKMRDGIPSGWFRRWRRNARAAPMRNQNHSLRPLVPRRVLWFPANAGRAELALAQSTPLESCRPAPGSFGSASERSSRPCAQEQGAINRRRGFAQSKSSANRFYGLAIVQIHRHRLDDAFLLGYRTPSLGQSNLAIHADIFVRLHDFRCGSWHLVHKCENRVG